MLDICRDAEPSRRHLYLRRVFRFALEVIKPQPRDDEGSAGVTLCNPQAQSAQDIGSLWQMCCLVPDVQFTGLGKAACGS